MAAFTVTGLFVSIVLAFVTSVVVAPAVNIILTTTYQQLLASIKSARMSIPSLDIASGVSSSRSLTQQDILLHTVNSTTFVLTTPAEPANSTVNTFSNAMSTLLMVPQIDTTKSPIGSPSTPVLDGKSAETSMPALNLNNVNNDTPLITASPYAQNEGLTFSKGTSLWQPTSPAIIRQQVSSPSLWTPANAGERKTKSSAPLSMRPMTAPLPASNLITQSPFCSNEGFKIPADTSMWQPGSAAAFKTPASTARPSLITSSPYDCNETVTFRKARFSGRRRRRRPTRPGV